MRLSCSGEWDQSRLRSRLRLGASKESGVEVEVWLKSSWDSSKGDT